MNSRRKFLVQGSLAATAVLALKPLETIARVTSPFTGASGSYSKLVFLHTANLNPSGEYKVIQYIKKIKNRNPGAILLKAGKDIKGETGQITYDVARQGSNDRSAISGDYKIINKGNLRTGVISANPGDSDVIQKINTLSAYLKKEKNCSVVVCLSGLGYENKNTPDDITLAKKSTHLDIIIGGHTQNFHPSPNIILNKKSEEVVIHSASEHTMAYGIIDIDLDDNGRKRQISFSGQA